MPSIIQAIRIFAPCIALTFFVLSCEVVLARDSERTVDYGSALVLDSDLDGLTNEGEEQLFGTKPKLPDTDGDGLLDGAEILSGSDPLNSASTHIKERTKALNELVKKETPWVWYVGRASGLAAFVCLWCSLVIALSVRNPLLQKIVAPLYRLDLHIFLALSAFFWGLFHGMTFLFDKLLKLSWLDVFIPFHAQTLVVDPMYLSLGILALYGFVILITIALLRNRIPRVIFRVSHFLNIPVAIMIFMHASKLGTDMNGWVYSVFIMANVSLAVFWVMTLVIMIRTIQKQRMFTVK